MVLNELNKAEQLHVVENKEAKIKPPEPAEKQLDDKEVVDSPQNGDSEIKSLNSSNSNELPELTSNSGTSINSSNSSFSNSRNEGDVSGVKRHRRASSSNHSPLFAAKKPVVTCALDKPTKKLYKQLKQGVSKFKNSRGAFLANCLRLTLLTFLRNHELPASIKREDRQGLCETLGLWWEAILNELKNAKDISKFDRNAYYEALSSIVSYSAWNGLQLEHTYQNLLQSSITYLIQKNNNTNQVQWQVAVLIGKLFAYGFIFLPGFANHILCIMNPSQATIERTDSLLSIMESTEFKPEVFPLHLRAIISAKSIPQISKSDAPWLPSTDLYSNDWSRLLQADSILFASFIKHYFSLQCELIYASGEVAPQRILSLLLNAPGMMLILSSVSEYVSNSIKAILNLLKTSKPGFQKNSSMILSGTQFKPRIDQLRILVAFREIIHSDSKTICMAPVLVKLIDVCFQGVLSSIKVYDMGSCVFACDVAEEWLMSLFSVNASKIYRVLQFQKSTIINWSFWLEVPIRMLESGNIFTESRALSFLFNIWPFIFDPKQNNSPGNKMLSYLLQTPVWSRLFFHWSPLVRSYYHRLLCYRVCYMPKGVEPESAIAKYITGNRMKVWSLLNASYNLIMNMKTKTEHQPETNPSLPIPKSRIGISPAEPSNGTRPSSFQLHPFDVFDSAAYLAKDSTYSQLNPNESTDSVKSMLDSILGESRSSVKLSRPASQHSRTSSRASIISTSSRLSVSSTKSNRFSFVKRWLSRKSRSQNSSAEARQPAKPSKPTKPSSPASASASVPASTPSDSASIISNNTTIDDTASIISTQSNKTEFDADAVKSLRSVSSNNSLLGTFREKCGSNALYSRKLKEPLIDIKRPRCRFLLVPTKQQPLAGTDVAFPTLPFNHEELQVNNLSMKDIDHLTVWNYGSRSLAEWNINVFCFEAYVNNIQHGFVEMPRLTAEIPWKLFY